MPLSDHAQCAMTVMWFSSFGMIISFLLNSPLIFLFAFAFVFNCFSLMKGMSMSGEPKKNNTELDELDEVELQPLEMVVMDHTTTTTTNSGGSKVNFKDNKNMTLGDLLNKY